MTFRSTWLDPRSARQALAMLASLSCLCYGAIAWLSPQFHFVDDASTLEGQADLLARPIPTVLGLLALAFLFYVMAIWIAHRAGRDRVCLAIVVAAAIGMRVVLLFSTPIQEVDTYRYILDGSISSQGVNPFTYTPEQILAAPLNDTDEQLAKIAAQLESDPPLRDAATRVRHSELTTIYPPVSQLVFAGAALSTPRSSPLDVRVIITKTWFVGFDLLTLGLVIGLLRLTGQPALMCVTYAWCPLLMKEFANSGHVDSLAILLSVSAIYLSLWTTYRSPNADGSPANRRVRNFVLAIGSSIVLAFAVGAKLYPIIFAPLLFLLIWKTCKAPVAVLWSMLFVGLVGVVLFPMLASERVEPSIIQVDDDDELPVPIDDEANDLQTIPESGLQRFLGSSEMNDFVFMVIAENLRPNDPLVRLRQLEDDTLILTSPCRLDNDLLPAGTVVAIKESDTLNLQTMLRDGNAVRIVNLDSTDVTTEVLSASFVIDEFPQQSRIDTTAWFSVLPTEARSLITNVSVQQFAMPVERVPFVVARVVTLLLYVFVFFVIAANVAQSNQRTIWLRGLFLVTAWFCLLCPTQHPWYWAWALPLLPFVRSRVWYAMSGLVLLYYLRFWFSYHWPDAAVADVSLDGNFTDTITHAAAWTHEQTGRNYSGVYFFDYVVTWVEFAPWLVCLIVAYLLSVVRARFTRSDSEPTEASP